MRRIFSQKRSSTTIGLSLALCVMLAVWAVTGLRPQPAQAIPMFASRSGAACEVCHTVFPGMTNFGMMVMMSNFSMLPYESAFPSGPTSLIFEEAYGSNPDAGTPKLRTENLGFLSGGFIGPHVTYYLEQHYIDGGFIGGTDQLWLSYNALFGGTGALQIGKFHTPFPFMPAHRITLAPYATTSATIGANDFNEDDSHWGVTLSQMRGTLMYGLSALGGNDEIGPGALQVAGNHDHSLDFSLMTMSDQPLNFGIGLIRGFAPLDSGADAFSRDAVYLQYMSPRDPRLTLQAVGQLGYDSDPFGTGKSAHTRGAFVEAQYRLSHANFGIMRWDAQNGDSPVAGVTLDFIHLIAPNAKLTLEAQALTSGTRFGAALAWAGPWTRAHVLAQPKFGAMPGMNMGGMSMSAMPSMARMPGMPGMPGMQMAQATLPELAHTLSHGDAVRGLAAFQLHGCASCHGVGGRGGSVGPRLIGIADSLTPEQIYAFIKRPRQPMPDFKLSDSEIADLVAYVVSLAPGHTVQADIMKEYHLSAASEQPAMMGMMMGMAPPTYPPEQPPLESGPRGLFRGIELGDPDRGAPLFAVSCGSCHGAAAAGASAAKLFGLADRLTPSAIAWNIRDHAPPPPNLKLSDRQIADLVAYLESLGAPRAKAGAPLGNR